jgi:c-di-GMP-binding flagellar brake protein YcgR
LYVHAFVGFMGTNCSRMQAVTAMEPEEKTAELASGGQNRRAAPRHGLDEEASLLLVNHGSTVSCRVVDLSLGGCCLRTKERFAAGSMVHVEVTFRARGLAFRFSGMTQWTDSRHRVGIRFVDVPLRRREELVEALFEVAAENAAKAARQAAEKRAAEERIAVLKAETASITQPAEQKETQQAPVQIPAPATADQIHPLPGALPVLPGAAVVEPAVLQKAEAQAARSPQAKPNKRDRREASREEVDSSAVIDLIKIASKLRGRILDLSLGGCRIRTDERFPVGIYTRVETEFRLEGLPFRLGGVVQAIHDKHMVGIRFLDMSSRKREQVEELMEDIREMKDREQGTGNRE